MAKSTPARKRGSGTGEGAEKLPLREMQKEFTRQRLIDSALEVFDEFGYSATTMEDIAESANVNRGTIYLHFDRKVDILHAALDRLRADELEVFEAARTARDRSDLEAVFDRTLTVWAERLGPVWRHVRQAAGVDESIRKWLERVVAAEERKTQRLLEDHGVPRDAAAARAHLLLCMWSEFLHTSAGTGARLDRGATMAALADFFQAARTPSARRRRKP